MAVERIMAEGNMPSEAISAASAEPNVVVRPEVRPQGILGRWLRRNPKSRMEVLVKPEESTQKVGIPSETSPTKRYLSSEYDPAKIEKYTSKIEGMHVVYTDPDTGKEVVRVPRIEGGAGEPPWLKEAQEERAPSEYEAQLDRRAELRKVNLNKLTDDQKSEFNGLVNQNNQEIDRLITEAQTQNRRVLKYFYEDIRNIFREVTAEPTASRYGEESRRLTSVEKAEMLDKALNKYQETFWQYDDPALSGLESTYRGVATDFASLVKTAIEKDLRGITLSEAVVSERLIIRVKEEIEAEKERRRNQEAFWDRTWGRIILTGRTPEDVRRGVDNFLKVATSEESIFDARRMAQEDVPGLNQEIQRVGQNVGMEREQVLELVARAEGTLLINGARYYARRWHVDLWHDLTHLVSQHIDTRLNAVLKAHDAEVIHAANILDSDEEFDKYGRPARFLSEKSSHNDQAAKSEIDKMRRRLEVRIALSQIKDINTVVGENFAGIEALIDSFGFDRSTQLPTELFNNQKYQEAIDKINEKLTDLNNGVPGTPQLTDAERKLFVLDGFKSYEKTEDLVVFDQTDEQFRNLFVEYGGFGTKEKYDAEIQRLKGEIPRLQQKVANKEDLTDEEKGWLRFWERDQLLKKVEAGKKLTDEQLRNFQEIDEAQRAVDLAIKTREVFFVSAEKACASLITRHITAEEADLIINNKKYATEAKKIHEKVLHSTALTEGEQKFWQSYTLLKKTESKIPLTETERTQLVDYAKEKEAGELLSFNDVLRFNKFVRERAIASLPAGQALAITADTRGGQGLMYVDIADKLEFRAIAEKTIRESKDNTQVVNAKKALELITLTAAEEPYAGSVQAVEDVQNKALDKLKESGSSITTADIDAIIKQVFQSQKFSIDAASQALVTKRTKTIHKGEAEIRDTKSYRDIINREDADPNYNFYLIDDQKYSSLLLSDEFKAAAYNPAHPYHLSLPAKFRRILDPDGNKLVHLPDPDLERAAAFRVMETQRRFHCAVDSVKVFGAFYQPNPYSDKAVNVEYVENIRNSPFIARRMIEQRFWTLWNRGLAYRGRGFLKYLESNFRGLDHELGVRGLREVIAAYNGFRNPKGFDYDANFSGGFDELSAEHWLSRAKGAEGIRPVLQGGQVGQEPNFEGIFKKIIKTIGRNELNFGETEDLSKAPPLARIAMQKWDVVRAGDYEKAITEIEDRWVRVTTYGNSLNFVGNVSDVPLARKFSGDTAVKRLAYWCVAHPEAASTYSLHMGLTRAILTPLNKDANFREGYFGTGTTFGPTLLAELVRRAILVK